MLKVVAMFLLLLASTPHAFAKEISVTMHSYGPVELHMSVDEAYQLLRTLRKTGVSKPSNKTRNEDCSHYFPWPGLAFMTNSGSIVQISTTEKNVSTPYGVRVGDPIEKVRSVFKSHHTKEYPQRYSADWQNDKTFIVFSANREMAIRFDISKVVTEIISGSAETVERIEGCS